MLGLGSLSSLGIGEESVYGTPVAATHWLPFTQESMAGPRESIPSGQLIGQRTVQNLALGIKQVGGGFTLENDCANIGMPLKLWNGQGGYSVDNMNSLNYAITSTPTCAVSGSGNTIPAGAYRYKVALLLKRPQDLHYVFGPASPSSNPITVALGEQVTVTVPTPTLSAITPPLGFAVAGLVLYRTPVGGASGTETFLRYALGTGNTIVDTGGNSPNADSTVVFVPTTNAFRHTYNAFVPTSGVEPIPSFTCLINKDNDKAEQYNGCRMNEFTMGASGGNAPTNMQFTCLGRNVLTVDEETPTYTNLQPVLGWKTAAFVNGSSSCSLIEAFEIKGTNNGEAVPGFCATPFNRDVASGMRGISGMIKRNFDNHEFFDKVQLGEEFSLTFNMYGQSFNADANKILRNLQHGIDAIPFPYFMEVDLFRCRTNKAGGPVSGPGRIIEDIEFTAFYSSAMQTEMRIRLYNLTSTYAI